jgi:hypothetical protein
MTRESEGKTHECVSILGLLMSLRRQTNGNARKPRIGFDPGSVREGFVVEKVALGQISPRVLRFSPVTSIPPVLHSLGKDKIYSTAWERTKNTPQLGKGQKILHSLGKDKNYSTAWERTKITPQLGKGQKILHSLGKDKT